MFTKKLEDQFSADLLNTVRGILGESKHDKERECEKCEDEEEDDEDEDEDETGKKKMKEGFASAAQRKAVWATYADGGKGHPDKKKKMKKEEVEQIDEIGNTPAGKRALGRYIKDRRGTILGAGMGMERQNKDRSTTDQQRKDLGRRAWNAHVGVGRAVDRLTKEEAEQIDELSKATMGRYVNKAAERMSTQGVTAGLKIAADEKSKKNFDNIAKRQKGIATAVKKLTKEEQDFIDALNNDTLEEARVYPGDYHVTSEKSQFGGHRPKVVHKDKGHTMYLGSHSYKKPAMAVKHGEAYLTAYSARGDRAADNASMDFARANKKHLYVKEEFELEEGRGRPPKEGSAAWHAKQKQATDDMPALGMQLRKAKSMNKKSDISFPFVCNYFSAR